MFDKKNAIAYAEICSISVNICKCLTMRHNFYLRDFENAIICGKICDTPVLAKYAIAYSHITSIINIMWLSSSPAYRRKHEPFKQILNKAKQFFNKFSWLKIFFSCREV